MRFSQNHIFENDVPDYSKTNEYIDLKLDIPLKNTIIFCMNIKLFKKDQPTNFYKSFLPIFFCEKNASFFFKFAVKNANF